MKHNEWICLKEIPGQFILGKIYTGDLGISYLRDDEEIINFCAENNTTRAFWIHSPIQKWLKFSDYFGKLNNWRDKQIDKILDDGTD
jgi:hypothetical protein